MKRTLIVLLTAASLAIPVVAESAGSKVEFAQAGVVCVPVDQIVGISSRSLILGIEKYDPRKPSVSIRVSILDKAGNSARLLGRVSLFPAEPFHATPEDPDRRFLLPLRQHAELIEGLDDMCMRVELIDGADDVVSGDLAGFFEVDTAR